MFLFNILIKNLIENTPTSAEIKIPRKSGKFIIISESVFINFIIPSKPAPKVAGRANKKEYSVAKGLFKPLNNPATIVEPEREIPGIMAIPWAVPIKRESR